jgi:hypothetical protein
MEFAAAAIYGIGVVRHVLILPGLGMGLNGRKQQHRTEGRRDNSDCDFSHNQLPD